ncbi:MAG: family 16 glycoside hydrolase [Mycobacteriales bacterium]
MLMKPRSVLVAAVLVAGSLAVPAAAGGSRLVSTPYAVVDLGDRVAWSVEGPSCSSSVARVHASWRGRSISGVTARPASGTCQGTAQVPTFAQLHAAGWRQGDPLTLALESGSSKVVLRYQRIEVDAARPASGSPSRQPATPADPDTGRYDHVMAMATGDAVDLGRVDVRGVNAIALRVCVTGTPAPNPFFAEERLDVPARMSLRQDSPEGPALVHGVDVANDAFTFTDIGTPGFGGTCWRLASRVVTGSPAENAPRLFLRADAALPGSLQVNSIDINGSAGVSTAGPQWAAPDPAGMRTLFNGRSFKGWTQTGCALRDGAATSARTGDRTQRPACTMTFGRKARNQVLRLEVRKEQFEDNGGIYLPHELQIRSIGEYGPLGYLGEYAARWQKLSSWPVWSTVEVVQLGARYVARLNGRTVMDHLAESGDPGPYAVTLATQPQFSQRYSLGTDGQNEPDPTTPDEYGGVWFRNVRAYQCTSVRDAVCVGLANVNVGQAPRR